MVRIMEIWFDSVHHWNMVMGGYGLFRKNKQGK